MWKFVQSNKIGVYVVIGLCTIFYLIDNSTFKTDLETPQKSKVQNESFSKESVVYVVDEEISRKNSEFQENAIFDYRQNIEEEEAVEDTKKTILFWNSYWHWGHYKMGVGRRGFAQCSFSNCYTTTMKSKLLKNPRVIVDAVIFHGVGLNVEEIKSIKKIRKLIPEKNQGVDPLFILFMLESPKGGNLHDPVFNDFFNLTFTYRKSADISRPYGVFIDKHTEEPIDFTNVEYIPNQIENNSKHNKTKDIAWLVSHCDTESKREDYVQALQNLNFTTMKIDIYGDCGPLELPKPQDHSSYLESYRTMAKDYKFYLSFENSLCYEYITEKFFYAMASGMIPIVYGGLSKEDYKSIAPPHSFIHVDDYDTPKELMETLVNISQNETLYQSYFWWKTKYDLSQEVDRESQCLLCLLLNNIESFKLTNDYTHFTEYWNKCRL